MLPQRQQRGAFGLLGRRERFPFRTADAAEEDGIRRLADRERFGRQRVAVAVDGCAPHERTVQMELEREFFPHGAEHVEGFGHDLGADAVTGENCDLVVGHGERQKVEGGTPKVKRRPKKD